MKQFNVFIREHQIIRIRFSIAVETDGDLRTFMRQFETRCVGGY